MIIFHRWLCLKQTYLAQPNMFWCVALKPMGEMNNARMNIRGTKTPRSAKQSLTDIADFILLLKKYTTPNSTNNCFTKSIVLRNHLILLRCHVIVSVQSFSRCKYVTYLVLEQFGLLKILIYIRAFHLQCSLLEIGWTLVVKQRNFADLCLLIKRSREQLGKFF